MLTRLLLVIMVVALVATTAFAETTARKDGIPAKPWPGPPTEPSSIRYDWVYNTGGVMDFVPDLGGSFDGWGEWFITTVYNDTGEDLLLVEFGFPCSGPPTETYGWVVWTGMPGLAPPVGSAYTAEYFGSFVPIDPDPNTWPPTTYTYVDVSTENIVIPAAGYFCFGYDNTGMGGQTYFNNVQTWAWYGGAWDPDESWGRTAILQVKANFTGTPVDGTSWAAIKNLFH